MKRLLVVLVLVGLVPYSCATAQTVRPVITLPDDVKIIPPSLELSKELAAFSGRWEGKWDNGLEYILIVEEINEKEARVVHAPEAQRYPHYIAAYCKRFIAKIVSGKKLGIEFTNELGSEFSFEMQKDLNTLEGVRFYQGRTIFRNHITMKRAN